MKKLLALLLAGIMAALCSMPIYAADSLLEEDEDNVTNYEKYETYYKGSDLRVGKDIPAGNYVVFSDKDCFTYKTVYEMGNTLSVQTNDRRFVLADYSEYSDVIHISANQYISVYNGALVPESLVEKMDTTQNGTFRVGKDISSGHYTFRLDPASATGYIEIRSLSSNSNTKVYKLNEYNTDLTINLTGGKVVKKYGVDMYDSSLRMYADYSPRTEISSNTDNELNFSDIRSSYKSDILSEFSDYIKVYSAGSKSSTRYQDSYVQNITNSWKSSAVNSAEKKYADITTDMMYKFCDFAQQSNPQLCNAASVELYGTVMTGSEYKKLFDADKQAYMDILLQYSNAESFADCELYRYNMYSLYCNVPRGQGTARS